MRSSANCSDIFMADRSIMTPAGTMKNPNGRGLSLWALTGLFLAGTMSAQELHWANSLGVSGESCVLQVRTDAHDNVYVLGSMNNSGAVDLDPGPGTQVHSWNFGDLPGSGHFIAKYDSTGNYLWGYRQDALRSIAVSPSGDIVCLAYLEDFWDADPGSSTHMISASEGVGVARWSTNGTFISAFAMDGPHALLCATNDEGAIFLYGQYTGTFDADPGPASEWLASNGYYDSWLARYDASGSFVWAFSIGGVGQEYASDLRLHGPYLFTTLRTVGPPDIAQFDLDPGPDTVLTNFDQHLASVVAVYTVNGTFERQRCLNLQADWRSPLIRPLPSGGVALAGGFSGAAQFDTPDSTFSLMSSGTDAFIERLDHELSNVWLDLFSTYGNEIVYDMTPAKDGAILVGGVFTHTIDVDPGPGISIYQNSPPGDAWLGSYCYDDGSLIWSALISGQSTDRIQALTWSEADALVLGGGVSTGADIGVGGSPHPISTSASSSAFVARYRQVNTTCVPAGVGIDPDHPDTHGSPFEMRGGHLMIHPGVLDRRLVIVDARGSVVYQRDVLVGGMSVDMGFLEAGFYIIGLTDGMSRHYQKIVLD